VAVRQLVLCIDLEQDDIRSTPDALQSWLGSHRALEWWRSLQTAWGADAHCNWFVRSDVQIAAVLGDAGWPLRELRAPLAEALAAGDSVGLHPHLYRLGPEGWRNDFADTDFAWQCASTALHAYREEFGHFCPIWRWGDRAGHRSLAPRLAAHGVQFDATAEPGRIGLPPRDGGIGTPPSFVGHTTKPSSAAADMVDWPVTTYTLGSLGMAATGQVAASPIGSFDSITDQWVHGWCLDADRVGAQVDVELLLHGVVAERTCAGWYRADLRNVGYGDGHHGARFAVRDAWRRLPLNAFQLRPVGHEQPLPGHPTDHRTGRGQEATVLSCSLDSEPIQFEQAVDMLLRGEDGHLTIATRSDVFVDERLMAAVDANTRTLQAHVLAGRLSPPRTLAAAYATLVPGATTG
jgi:hypothetical protein